MKCEDDRKDEYFRYIAIVDGTLMITEDGHRMVGYILKFDEESKNNQWVRDDGSSILGIILGICLFSLGIVSIDYVRKIEF